jgi:hypothetical protein
MFISMVAIPTTKALNLAGVLIFDYIRTNVWGLYLSSDCSDELFLCAHIGEKGWWNKDV